MYIYKIQVKCTFTVYTVPVVQVVLIILKYFDYLKIAWFEKYKNNLIYLARKISQFYF